MLEVDIEVFDVVVVGVVWMLDVVVVVVIGCVVVGVYDVGLVGW